MEKYNNRTDGHEGEKSKLFLSLILDHKDRVYAYILTLVPRQNIAEDIMQEAVLTMWDKFHTFKVGTNFYAWAKCIALNKIREHHRNSTKSSATFFDENVIDKLNNSDEEREPEKRLLIEKLDKCLKALSKIEFKLIQLRFTDKIAIKDIAQSWGKSSGFLYREMSKILYRLRECMMRQQEV